MECEYSCTWIGYHNKTPNSNLSVLLDIHLRLMQTQTDTLIYTCHLVGTLANISTHTLYIDD